MLGSLQGIGLVIRDLERLARVPPNGREEERGVVKVLQLWKSHSHSRIRVGSKE
jgi:hypothetical protein